MYFASGGKQHCAPFFFFARTLSRGRKRWSPVRPQQARLSFISMLMTATLPHACRSRGARKGRSPDRFTQRPPSSSRPVTALLRIQTTAALAGRPEKPAFCCSAILARYAAFCGIGCWWAWEVRSFRHNLAERASA